MIGRFFNVAGPRQVGRYGMVLPRFVDQALTGGPLIVHDDGRQVRCFAHVADVVAAVLEADGLCRGPGRVFNLGSDMPVTIRELAELVVRLVDPSLAIEHVAYERAFTPGFEDIRCRIPDLTRVRETINYRPRHGLEDIIRDVLAWKRADQQGAVRDECFSALLRTSPTSALHMPPAPSIIAEESA